MALLNYTTTIDAEQSIAEMQKLLVKYGVHAMRTDYDGPQVSAVSFSLDIAGKEVGFRLPCNWRGVRAVFDAQGITRGKIKHRDKDIDAQAIRTSWRIIREWVVAQLALVEVNMVTIPQVFLPYAITRDGHTLGEKMMEKPGLLLGSGD